MPAGWAFPAHPLADSGWPSLTATLQNSLFVTRFIFYRFHSRLYIRKQPIMSFSYLVLHKKVAYSITPCAVGFLSSLVLYYCLWPWLIRAVHCVNAPSLFSIHLPMGSTCVSGGFPWLAMLLWTFRVYVLVHMGRASSRVCTRGASLGCKACECPGA